MVFDFGALPPEVNSGKIYSGPGSAPLLAAATAWDALASELQTTAAGYASTHHRAGLELAGTVFDGRGQRGSALHEWLSSTAAQAEQTAAQAQAAAAAYEAAFAASIPPPVIAANRARWRCWSQPTSWAEHPRDRRQRSDVRASSGPRTRAQCTATPGPPGPPAS